LGNRRPLKTANRPLRTLLLATHPGAWVTPASQTPAAGRARSDRGHARGLRPRRHRPRRLSAINAGCSRAPPEPAVKRTPGSTRPAQSEGLGVSSGAICPVRTAYGGRGGHSDGAGRARTECRRPDDQTLLSSRRSKPPHDRTRADTLAHPRLSGADAQRANEPASSRQHAGAHLR
jgi:hypothetical protein